MSHAARPRSAFTLIELLVVIAIIVSLMAILLPAIQKVRDAANRMRCASNIRQLAIACHMYENSRGQLPPAYISDQTKPAGWGTFLLPYIERSDLFGRYNFGAPFFYVDATYGIDNQSVVNTKIPIFNCPSAPERDPYQYTFTFPGFPSFSWQASASDFSPISVSSTLANYLGLTYTDNQLRGALQPDKGIAIDQIKDGSSNTILLAEIAGKNQLWQAGTATGQTLSGFYGGQGGWGDATSGATALYGSSADGKVAPGNFGVNCSNDYGLYGFHQGSVNVVFADGSVRQVTQGANIANIVALITREGREPTPVDY